jgi:hypothetical protein
MDVQVVSSAVYIFTMKDEKVLSLVSADDQIGILLHMGRTVTPPVQK